MTFELKSWREGQPRLSRSVTLQFIGDWGRANFHRVCSWLCQEFCDRAGSRSRVGIWNTVYGGIDALTAVHDGEVDLCVITPTQVLPEALLGTGIFSAGGPMPALRTLAVLPQRDRMVLAVAGDKGVASFEDLRRLRPPLRIATSVDDGYNLIGYTARRYMEAHGVDERTLNSWGGEYIDSTRPETSLLRMRDGDADAVLQEAIMTPWWREAMNAREAVAFGAEADALAELRSRHGWPAAELTAGFLPGQSNALPALDFSDFAIVVRSDMAEDVAHLLTWCLVETRDAIERQFQHIPPDRSPLTYPLVPALMAQPPIPLHPGAARYFAEAGHLSQSSR